MKKITVIILLIFISLCTLAQSPVSGGNAPETDASGDTTQLAMGDNVLQFNPVVISKDSVNALKDSKDFNYLKNLDSLLRVAQKEKLREEKPSSSHETSWIEKFFGSVITRDVFWALAACFVLFILYKLFLTEGIFQKRSASIKVDNNEDEEEVPHTISDYNLFIEKAIAAKDFRLAVRYLYLQVLRRLSDDKQIQLAPDKTNYQYQLELKSSELKKLFALVTFQYECVWYGGFEINETAFISIRNDFKNFTAQL
jgi:hypothetical protein